MRKRVLLTVLVVLVAAAAGIGYLIDGTPARLRPKGYPAAIARVLDAQHIDYRDIEVIDGCAPSEQRCRSYAGTVRVRIGAILVGQIDCRERWITCTLTIPQIGLMWMERQTPLGSACAAGSTSRACCLGHQAISAGVLGGCNRAIVFKASECRYREEIMNLQARPYSDPMDLARMRQLLIAGRQATTLASYMHPGYLDFDTHCPPDEQENRRDLRLWERIDVDEGQPTLEAWAMYWRNEGAFDLFVSPALHGTPAHAVVMDAYIPWAEARAREAGLKQLAHFCIFDSDTVMQRLYQARGFEAIPADPPQPLFERTLDELPTVALPEGFTVQGVNNLADGRLRARVTHDAFDPDGDWDGYWAKYAQFMGSAVYDGARDLFVRAPDGRGASACTIWFDEVNAVGMFEPVGTHPDFQRQGLGKAVMAEGLRRMQAAGMRRASLVFNPNNLAARALYTSMDFRASCYFVGYRRSL